MNSTRNTPKNTLPLTDMFWPLSIPLPEGIPMAMTISIPSSKIGPGGGDGDGQRGMVSHPSPSRVSGWPELWHHFGYLVEMFIGAHSLQQTLTSLTATGEWLLHQSIYTDEGDCPSEKFISSGPKSKMKPQATPCPS